MSFDQNMIIDAAAGSMARFVNHSCSPNCRMIKWIVSGQPRMALFAGDRPIMTGEELTYDYNFDPFSANNVQKCLCGSKNCRGVLGPRSKEAMLPKQPRESNESLTGSLNKNVKRGVSAEKQKINKLLDDKEDGEGGTIRKHKIKFPVKPAPNKGTPEPVLVKSMKTFHAKPKSSVKSVPLRSTKASISNAGLRADSAATVVKRSVLTTANAKAALSGKPLGQKIAAFRKSSAIKTYINSKVQSKPTSNFPGNSGESSLTIVVADSNNFNLENETAVPGQGEETLTLS